MTMQVFFRTTYPQFLPCSAGFHEGSCHIFAIKSFFESLLFGLKIYLGIYSVPLVLFKSNSLVTDTYKSLLNLLKNAFRSGMFLTVNLSLAKYALCVLRNIWRDPGVFPSFFAGLAGFVGVVGLLIERKSRRLELVYYVLPQVYSHTHTHCLATQIDYTTI